MKKIISVLAKIIVLTAVFFVVNAIIGIFLPLSHDMIAALGEKEQTLFIPLYLLYIFIAMTALFITLKSLRYESLRLYIAVFISFFGLFSVLNKVEILWYIEAFPLYTTLDVIKMLLTDLFSYGITTLVGVWLVKGFTKEKAAKTTIFDTGHSSWKVAVFMVLYPLFYYCCGFIAWSFPAAREFYSGWAATAEPLYVLLLFNVFRGGLWLFFSLPLLLGARTRKQAFWLLPLILVIATAGGLIMPNAAMPPMVRLAHGIELIFSMTIVGIFMVWLFLKEKTGEK